MFEKKYDYLLQNLVNEHFEDKNLFLIILNQELEFFLHFTVEYNRLDLA